MWAACGGHSEVVELLVSKGANVSLVDRFGINILYSACLGGDVDVVKYVLSQNMLDINDTVQCGRTAVMLAAANGHKDMVELLVDKEADVSLLDEAGDNILHCACRGGDVKVVKYILSQEMVDINSRGYGKKTPVMVAGEEGHKGVVELLVKFGADLSLNGKSGSNILHYACSSGQFDVVKYVLSLNEVDIDSRGWKKRTPVMAAAVKGHKEVVELLVKHGADLSISEKSGSNILHLACSNGQFGVVEYVLSLNSVDINRRGYMKRTPVMIAAESGHKEVVELLVKHGANLLLTDKHGDNILHRACKEGHFDVVKYVLSLNSVDINSRGWEGRRLVMIPAEKGHKEVVELLVKHGANLLLTDKHGDNTLHRACKEGHFDVVKYVLSMKSVDINSPEREEKRPVMGAAERGKEVVELTRKHGPKKRKPRKPKKEKETRKEGKNRRKPEPSEETRKENQEEKTRKPGRKPRNQEGTQQTRRNPEGKEGRNPAGNPAGRKPGKGTGKGNCSSRRKPGKETQVKEPSSKGNQERKEGNQKKETESKETSSSEENQERKL
ncbi:ankyrin repeat domain-containing protein 50-like [Haliotis rubra]|uniref:ankyrin repeat domain-containing protein 50-like n=1 Tax=Haliotis rubra TaxID=36100 RepID=UPI001EE580A7|nr:ankyrin repeat domain-containing protein 50-like [Haliotis rubra]